METLRNASVPSAMMGRPGGGIERVDITIADGRIAEHRAAHARPGPRPRRRPRPAGAGRHSHPSRQGPHLAAPPQRGRHLGDRAYALNRRHDRALVGRPTSSAAWISPCAAAYAHGTAAIRTHIESTPPQHDISWEVFERMRDEWAGHIELQAVSLVGPDSLWWTARPSTASPSASQQAGGRLGGAVRSFPPSAGSDADLGRCRR